MNTHLRTKKNPRLTASAVLAALLLIAVVGVMIAVRIYSERSVISSPEPEPIPEPTLNTHLGSYFYGESHYLEYDGETDAILGVDVSSHQQEIDWSAVAATPVDFAIIRTGYRGYTKGAISEDAYFEQNLTQAKENGLKVGVYFFSQAISTDEAVEEAEFLLSQLNGRELDYPVFFDWEDIEPEARTDNMTSLEITACAKAFCERIEQDGYRAGVYFNRSFGYQELNLLELERYDFWLADYTVPSNFRYDFDFLQYSNVGFVNGIKNNVDLNLVFTQKNPAQ